MADERITDAIMVAVADQLRSNAGMTGSSNVEINIKGGSGLSIAVGCCVVMLVVALFQARDLSEAKAQLREQGHQLNAIYRVAPSVEREVRARLEEDARLREQATE